MIEEVLRGASATRPNLLFAANQALLGEVTPNLRRVLLDWHATPAILTCYYDGPITGLETGAADRVVSKINTWLPDARVELTLERVDYPGRPPTFPHSSTTREAVYIRAEPTLD